MRYITDKEFERQTKKMPKEVRQKMWERIRMMVAGESGELLRKHALNPPYGEYQSINITGDWRLIYKRISPDVLYLRAVGTHHQLFGT